MIDLNTDAVIMCGGYGTRIRDMLPPGQPKALADINGKPFLRILIDHLRSKGFRRYALCCSYGQDLIKAEFANDDDVGFFCEDEPMGTGATLRNLLRESITELSRVFVVINGDTFCDVDYARLLKVHSIIPNSIMTVVRNGYVNAGVFAVHSGIATVLEWEPRTRFNIEELPIHSAVSIIDTKTPFIDIGTPAGLLAAREKFGNA